MGDANDVSRQLALLMKQPNALRLQEKKHKV
jgi:hypothetical protein